MAVLDFTFANGALSVTGGGRTDNFYSTDFRARSKETRVIIFPINQDDNNRYTQKDWDYPYADISCQGTEYGSAELFVTAFNAVAGAAIGFNTKYPETLFSRHIALDTSVDEQVATAAIIAGNQAGYVTITTPSTNTGTIYVGDSTVNNTSYALEADKSITLEIDDLGKIWVQSDTPGDHVSVIGVAKV